MSASHVSSAAERLLRRNVGIAYALAVLLWLASLWLPAATVNESMRLTGYEAFGVGIDALGSGIFGWLANPLACLAIVAGLLSRFAFATVIAAAASGLGLSSLLAAERARADGAPIEQVTFEAGFFLWLTAFSMIFATSCLALWYSRRRRERANPLPH